MGTKHQEIDMDRGCGSSAEFMLIAYAGRIKKPQCSGKIKEGPKHNTEWKNLRNLKENKQKLRRIITDYLHKRCVAEGVNRIHFCGSSEDD